MFFYFLNSPAEQKKSGHGTKSFRGTKVGKPWFNMNEKSATIFFDVAAAFDKVWHKGLIYKLFELKVPFYLIAIISAFLKDRTFQVKVEGCFSSTYIIKCGVPQGGVLSPTLFSIYINDIPIITTDKEICLLFADDLVYQLRYKYKEKNKLIENAKLEAEKRVQEYLNKLEQWTNDWRLTLAPHKCGQITFTKAKNQETDDLLNVRLYNVNIPIEKFPKFLGILFDRRLSFREHCLNVDNKIFDRMNILKILSFDKNWRLDEKTLIRMYKSIVRSVIDYACVTSQAFNCDSKKDYEIIQNDALRIIFRKTIMDKVSIVDLRKKAGVASIEEIHAELIERFYGRAIVSNNPLIMMMFEKYERFKKRSYFDQNVAVNENGEVDLCMLDFVRNHNREISVKRETHPTTLCGASNIIKEFIFDDFAVGSGGIG